MAKLAKRLGLDLPDAFPCQLEFPANLLQRMNAAVVNAETEPQDAPFLFVEAGENVLNGVLEEALFSVIKRLLCLGILDEIAEHCVAFCAHRGVERNRLFGKA